MGVLTRAEMEAAIKAGGSVLHRGAIYHQIGQLPSEAELAEGDPEQEAAVAAALDAQIAALQTQRDRLHLSRQSPVIGPAHVPEKPAVEDTAGTKPAKANK
jgi:hypothetical protein